MKRKKDFYQFPYVKYPLASTTPDGVELLSELKTIWDEN